MASYELVFKKSVAKDLRRLPQQDIRRVLERIRSLADDPRPFGCEKLSVSSVTEFASVFIG